MHIIDLIRECSKMDFGSVPQWVTAFVAAAAFCAAVVSIRSQREIARKRAAVDFFTKTEMDKHTLNQHKAFKRAVQKFNRYKRRRGRLASFEKTKEYAEIRDYLNLHELMSVAIKRDVFDDHVCYDFWSGELERAYAETKELIAYIQSKKGEEFTYCELTAVHRRWSTRRKRRMFH